MIFCGKNVCCFVDRLCLRRQLQKAHSCLYVVCVYVLEPGASDKGSIQIRSFCVTTVPFGVLGWPVMLCNHALSYGHSFTQSLLGVVPGLAVVASQFAGCYRHRLQLQSVTFL